MSRVWFITGASQGFGRECVKQALKAGDYVIAAARRFDLLEEIKAEKPGFYLPLKLDVTDAASVKTAVDKALEAFGRIDVLVNNAGIGGYASVEELFCSDTEEIMNVNFYGSLNVIQAVLPGMRAQNSGRIIQISSVGGVVLFPLLAAYSASKWAVEALVETLAMETAAFNIKVTLVEPGPFDTGFQAASRYAENAMPAYDKFRREHFEQMAQVTFEDPAIVARGVLKLAALDNPPLRVTAGKGMLDYVKRTYSQRLTALRSLEDL